MSAQEIDKARNSADGKEKKDQFITLNVRKLYINSKDGLIHTKTLKVQAAPKLKEIVNNALFLATKKNLLPGRY